MHPILQSARQTAARAGVVFRQTPKPRFKGGIAGPWSFTAPPEKTSTFARHCKRSEIVSTFASAQVVRSAVISVLPEGAGAGPWKERAFSYTATAGDEDRRAPALGNSRDY